MTRTRRAAAVALLAAVLILTAATSALAGGPDKPGKGGADARVAGSVLVLYQAIPNIGELAVYWDGYQNTAYMRHIGDTWHVYSDTGVNICRSDRAGNCTGPVQSNRGNFWEYAGPVKSGPSAGSCVTAWGNISYWRNGAQYNARVVGACG